MGTAADTLVTKMKGKTVAQSRINQLNGPVYKYLLREAQSKRGAYSKDPADLYMGVFNPVSRKLPLSTEFSARIKKDNPGIKIIGDYVKKVEASKGPALTPQEEQALQNTARNLGVTRDSLYKLIAFESGWNPDARNRISGARGLIQFMPSTAKGLGYKETVDAMTVALFLVVGYLVARRYGLL